MKSETNISLIFLILSGVLLSVSLYYTTDKLHNYNLEYEQYEREVNSVSNYEYLIKDLNIRNLSGRYYPQHQIFAINASLSNSKDVQITTNHEMCHWLWYEHLSLSRQKRYEILFNVTVNYVTDYAKTNVNEDFAENCAYYLVGLEISKDKQLFMDKHIKRLLN